VILTRWLERCDSDKVCHSYRNLYFGITCLEHIVVFVACYQLVGIVKVSLHQFYMSYRDRKVSTALLRAQV